MKKVMSFARICVLCLLSLLASQSFGREVPYPRVGVALDECQLLRLRNVFPGYCEDPSPPRRLTGREMEEAIQRQTEIDQEVSRLESLIEAESQHLNELYQIVELKSGIPRNIVRQIQYHESLRNSYYARLQLLK